MRYLIDVTIVDPETLDEIAELIPRAAYEHTGVMVNALVDDATTVGRLGIELVAAILNDPAGLAWFAERQQLEVITVHPDIDTEN